MAGRDDLIASLRALMAATRRELGNPPAPEDLIAYRDGRLDKAEREQVERKIAAFPDAARALLDLAAFPEAESAPGVRVSTAEEIAANWEEFLPRAGAPLEPAAPADVAIPIEPSRSWPVSTWHRLRLAAALLTALGLGGASGFLLGKAGKERPAAPVVNVAIAELEPQEVVAARSAYQAVHWPATSQELVLVLGLLDRREYPDYQVEITDLTSALKWRVKGLRPTSLGMFQIGFRRGDLEPGRYRLILEGREGTQAVPLAMYELWLMDE